MNPRFRRITRKAKAGKASLLLTGRALEAANLDIGDLVVLDASPGVLTIRKQVL